jgi:hypothetical protein
MHWRINLKRKILSILAAFALACGVSVAIQPAASAHFLDSDSAALCGGGYNLVWQNGNDYMILDVRRNGNSWCAVTKKIAAHGVNTWTAAKIRPYDYTTFYNVDAGSYAHFAGPVYQGSVTCVDVSGAVTGLDGVVHWMTPDNIGC